MPDVAGTAGAAAGSLVCGGGVAVLGMLAEGFFCVAEFGGEGAGACPGTVGGTAEDVGAGVGVEEAGGAGEFVAVVVTGGVMGGGFVTAADLLWAKYWMPAMAEATTMRPVRPPINQAGRKPRRGGGGGTTRSWAGAKEGSETGCADPTRVMPGYEGAGERWVAVA